MRVIYDIETLSNCFTISFIDIDTLKVYSFVIHKSRNDYQLIKDFIAGCTLMVGFNNVDFDYPVLHEILTKDLGKKAETIAKNIYEIAQGVIDRKSQGEFVSVQQPLVRQMDLFRVHHFDNKNRMVSLKYLAINLGVDNVMEMPIPHTSSVSVDQIPLVLEYNVNDCWVTLELYNRSASKLKMRENLGKKYNVDMTNFPDAGIGKYIVLSKLSEKLNIPIQTLKKYRTFRKEIPLDKLILPSINFKTDEFNKVLQEFKNTTVTETRGSNDVVCVYDGVEYYFGFGGIHACRNNGVYHNVTSADVTGYYPSLAVSQGLYPAHLGPDFVPVLAGIAVERAMFPKGTDENVSLKMGQNASIGDSNSQYSPFYDPWFFASVTINGQLSLVMLCERLTLAGAARILLANTDGIECEVLDQVKFDDICRRWQKLFNLKLEFSLYSRLCVRDINAYIGTSPDGKIKLKGVYEDNDTKIKNGDLHKDFSMDVVTEAVRDYFISGTPVEETIGNCKDIKKFLIGARCKSGQFVAKGLVNGELVNETLPKNIRYYISKGGLSLYRRGVTDVALHKGYQMTLMNKLGEARFVNYQYYIREARKLIEAICQQNQKLDLR
jgi:hypothetical protein